MTEKRANDVYNTILKTVAIPLLTDQSTYSNDLERVGKMFLGNQFVGVFPADKIPTLANGEYTIVNLDKTGQAGSHWVSLAKHNGKITVYDSFGRDHKKIIPLVITSGNGTVIDTDRDAEQTINEYNCGARCFSWILLHKYWGPDMAQLI